MKIFFLSIICYLPLTLWQGIFFRKICQFFYQANLLVMFVRKLKYKYLFFLIELKSYSSFIFVYLILFYLIWLASLQACKLITSVRTLRIRVVNLFFSMGITKYDLFVHKWNIVYL